MDAEAAAVLEIVTPPVLVELVAVELEDVSGPGGITVTCVVTASRGELDEVADVLVALSVADGELVVEEVREFGARGPSETEDAMPAEVPDDVVASGLELAEGVIRGRAVPIVVTAFWLVPVPTVVVLLLEEVVVKVVVGSEPGVDVEVKPSLFVGVGS